MAKGYWVAHMIIHDQASYQVYIDGTKQAFAKYGARPLARGGRYACLEGTDHPRNVVLEFDSYEQAVACYESPEYQAARNHRVDAAVGHLTIVEGVDG